MEKIEAQEYAQKLLSVTFREAIQEMLKVMIEGKEKYKKDDWETRSVDHHLEHIRAHLDSYDKNRDFNHLYDLTHAMTRCMMLTQALINKSPNEYMRT